MSAIAHLMAVNAVDPLADQRMRFLQVLLDLLIEAPQTGTYLPQSSDRYLGAVLRHLDTNPADNKSLADFAHLLKTTERTLLRRCARDLRMPFAEWKQHLRVVKALPRMEGKDTIERISSAIGYTNPSSFIAMFKRMMGVTPDEYRSSIRSVRLPQKR